MTRFLMTCPTCKSKFFFDAEKTVKDCFGNQKPLSVPPCKCGNPYLQYKGVQAKVSKHTCDGDCKNAVSVKCVCSCGGVNHGVNHLVA